MFSKNLLPKMKGFIIITFVLLSTFSTYSQHTFSIVAVDTATGEVGSAGASCIDINNSYNISRINELVPGRGAINAQASWDFTNLANAKVWMSSGDSPQEIIDWLISNDAQSNPERMQYGIVDIDTNDRPRSAAFTGTQAYDYKNHNIGTSYSVQGNILIGQHVLDSIENKFNSATGTLAEKLMAALQGANFAGADQRCLSEGVSSGSAFIRVAKPADQNDSYFLDLEVPVTPYGVEPIDSLQVLFTNWITASGSADILLSRFNIDIYPNPSGNIIQIIVKQYALMASPVIEVTLVDLTGKVIIKKSVTQEEFILNVKGFSNGIYYLNLRLPNGTGYSKKIAVLHN